MRFILPVLILLAPMAYAEPPEQLSTTGDFDGDGKPDTVKQVAVGDSMVLEVMLSSKPDEPVRITGVPGQSPDLLATKPPGGYGIDTPSPILTEADVVHYGWKDGPQMILLFSASGVHVVKLNPATP